MRFAIVLFSLAALSACALMAPQMDRTALTLEPADAASSLTLGGPVTLERATPRSTREGQDPLVQISLRHPDGRTLAFTEANHTPHDVTVQAAGGPLAQVMGFYGSETPALYRAENASGGAHVNPFLCGPEGPVAIGYFEAANGAVTLVGLKSDFEFESLRDGTEQALPYSPDQVCARLKLRAAR
jgi:hypothetical protein